jgi:hypothetical protein
VEVLTLAEGAPPAGLRQAVALHHRAAQTHVHEAVCGGGEGRPPRQHRPRPAPQQGPHLPEHQPGSRGKGDNINSV